MPEDLGGVLPGDATSRRHEDAVSLRLPRAWRAIVEEVADDRACVNPRNVWRTNVGWSGIGNRRANASRSSECSKHSHVWNLRDQRSAWVTPDCRAEAPLTLSTNWAVWNPLRRSCYGARMASSCRTPASIDGNQWFEMGISGSR